MFSGTLRFNIDPLMENSDEALWNALELSHLKPFVERFTEGLEYECGENGEALRCFVTVLVCQKERISW